MKKKAQFFIIVNLAGPAREYTAQKTTLKARASEIKQKYNYNFPMLQKAV